MENTEMEFIKQKLEDFCEEILPYGDSIQVFFTKYNRTDDTTTSITTGKGNWYTRVGKVSEWLNQTDNKELEEEE